MCCILASVSVSVSAEDGIVALRKAHTCSAPSLSSLPKVALKTVPMFVWLNTDHSPPWRVEYPLLPFATPLSFRRSMLWCSCLSMFRSFSSLGAPLPCQAAEQMQYLLCLPVYLPIYSHWPWRTQDSRSTKVFVAKDWACLCASRGSPFQTPPFAGGSLSLWEWRHV